MVQCTIGRECGTFDEACKRAIKFANRRAGDLDMVQSFLHRAGWGHATFGIETIETCDRTLQDLNTGDTYDSTVLLEGEELYSGCWGDWVERVEGDYEKDQSVYRCCNCGEFTPAGETWAETVCTTCGRYVNSSEKPE